MNAKEASEKASNERAIINRDTRTEIYKTINRLSGKGRYQCYKNISHLYKDEVKTLIKELRALGYKVRRDSFNTIYIRWERKERS
ncbi:hypothetical protein AW02_008010 [Bacillus velezensis NJN-6]|uniref:hypothetical protein n=1 Tax=Bacillus amyloliquefaciens group TaxID=1938374 RepID=UPI000532DCFA|nr:MULTISPECIES: hypothetical protein [Bacillus amyloliquefaciens group]AKD28953.1 hypothetical protein AW02_008010 [Bacillus velezensis NJN-6]